jgi:hypothetical protein
MFNLITGKNAGDRIFGVKIKEKISYTQKSYQLMVQYKTNKAEECEQIRRYGSY